MSPDLLHRIQKVYPNGTICSLDKEALKDKERDKRILVALESVSKKCNLVFEFQPFDIPSYSICLTQADHPEFRVWLLTMDNAAKIRWITEYGSPYPVLWLKISRAFDYYYLYYNHWKQRGDSGYLDADFRDTPNEQWKENQKTLEITLQQHGFLFFQTHWPHRRHHWCKRGITIQFPMTTPDGVMTILNPHGSIPLFMNVYFPIE